MSDEAHEAMRALAGAVCPKCSLGFDEIKVFTDPDARPADGGSFVLRMRNAPTMIMVFPCKCRITSQQYADVKRRLRS